MKTSTVGLVLAAILVVVAAVGFGIAQAEDTHTNGGIMEWQTHEQSDSSSPDARVLPSGIDLSYDADGNPTQGMAQARGAIETGSLPTECNVDSSVVEIEGVGFYCIEKKLYGP